MKWSKITHHNLYGEKIARVEGTFKDGTKVGVSVRGPSWEIIDKTIKERMEDRDRMENDSQYKESIKVEPKTDGKANGGQNEGV